MSTKDRIMESTFKLLLEEGLLDVSLSQIVKESQVGYGSIYYYFEDKDQLIQCVLNKYIIDMFLNQIETFKLSDDLMSNLNLFYKKVLGLNDDDTYISYNNFSIDDVAFKKMILLTFEGQQRYELVRSYFKNYNLKFTKTVKDIIIKGIDTKQIKKDIDIDNTVFSIKSNIYGIFFLWLIEDINDVQNAIKINIENVQQLLC